jgi:hypothetical protein
LPSEDVYLHFLVELVQVNGIGIKHGLFCPDGILAELSVRWVLPLLRVRPVLEIVQIIKNLPFNESLRLVLALDHPLLQQGEQLASLVFGELPEKLLVAPRAHTLMLNGLGDATDYIFDDPF